MTKTRKTKLRCAGREENMTDYIKSKGYIYVNLCRKVSRALHEAMTQKGWLKHQVERRAHGGNMSLSDIADTLAKLGAHMEVTVKFIDAPVALKGQEVSDDLYVPLKFGEAGKAK